MQHAPSLDTSRDIGQRVLRLIEGLRTPADLSPANVASVTGLPVAVDPRDPSVYCFGQTLDDRWIFNATSLPANGSGAGARMEFAFDDQTGEYADLSAVCGLDFDAHAQALHAAGYACSARTGSAGAFYGYDFTRDAVSVLVRVRAENAANPAHLCVDSLIVRIAEVTHG